MEHAIYREYAYHRARKLTVFAIFIRELIRSKNRSNRLGILAFISPFEIAFSARYNQFKSKQAVIYSCSCVQMFFLLTVFQGYNCNRRLLKCFFSTGGTSYFIYAKLRKGNMSYDSVPYRSSSSTTCSLIIFYPF